jgi:hypothetical protein
MDVLVLGDYLVTRKSEGADAHTSAEPHHA